MLSGGWDFVFVKTMILSYQPELIFNFEYFISRAKNEKSKARWVEQYEIFKKKKLIGFWKYNSVNMSESYSKELNELLPDPKDYIDNSWNSFEKERVVGYLKSFKPNRFFLGDSECRICGCSNGSKEYADDVFFWPEGFSHYLEAHNVKPPQEFINNVLSKV